MSSARVDDIDILKMMRATLFKFAEGAQAALGDAESEIHRTISWLENEQAQHWSTEFRKRSTVLSQAKEQLRMKKVFSGPAGSKQSCVDEEKAVQLATKRLAEAEAKIAAVKNYSRRMQKEMLLYKGQVQRFQTTTSVDIPLAATLLGNMVIKLETYASLAPANAVSSADSASSTAGAAGGPGGMARSADGVAPSLTEVFQALRQNTPPAAERINAPPGSADFGGSAAGLIADADRETLASLKGGKPFEPTAKIVISGAMTGKKRLYFERLEPAGPGDSGWYVGPAEVGVGPPYVAVPAAETMQARPDWTELLSLPVGSLVIIDSGIIATVLTIDGKDIWTNASMTKLLNATEPTPGDPAAEPASESAATAAAPA